MRVISLLLILGLLGCADETISGYADPDATYRLVEINGAPFSANATISFLEEGQAGGEAPCNTWSATQSVPYPWFNLGPIAATRRACPNLEAEALYFESLGVMSLAEIQGPILILTDDDQLNEMVFKAD